MDLHETSYAKIVNVCDLFCVHLHTHTQTLSQFTRRKNKGHFHTCIPQLLRFFLFFYKQFAIPQFWTMLRMRWSSSVSVWGSFSTDGSPVTLWLLIVKLRAVFCPSVQYLSFFCEAFSWTIFDSSRFPLFHSGQVFHKLLCPLTVVVPQINLTTLFSYPLFLCLFHTPLDVIVHFLVFFRSFTFKSILSFLLLSHKSRILQWPNVFSFDHVCKGYH